MTSYGLELNSRHGHASQVQSNIKAIGCQTRLRSRFQRIDHSCSSLLWFRRRKQGQQEDPAKPRNEADSTQIVETFSSQRYELPARSAPTELPPNEISELDGSC
jgi:hypothetical protein